MTRQKTSFVFIGQNKLSGTTCMIEGRRYTLALSSRRRDIQSECSNAVVTSNELDYMLPNIWLQANPDHRWEINEIRRTEREAKDV